MSREALEAVLPQFIGEIGQIPPMYSALKVGGQKLVDLARRGITVDINKRPVTLEFVDIDSNRVITEPYTGQPVNVTVEPVANQGANAGGIKVLLS